MIECRGLKTIQRIKLVLSFVLLALGLLNLYLTLMGTVLNVEKLTQWPRQPAEIFSLAGETEVEIEVAIEFADALPTKKIPENCYAHQPGNTCLLLPSNPYAWLSVFDQVELLQNPNRPEQLEILSLTGLWFPVCGYFLFVLLLAAAWRWLARSGWGEDRTWLNGAWIATESTPLRIGFTGMDAEPITETSCSRKAVIFWSVLFLFIALLAVLAAIVQMSSDPLLSMVMIIGGVGMLLLALFTAVNTFSRILYQDQTGLVGSSFFGIKRVPWSGVADVNLVNLNREAQQRYDRSHSAKDSRPQTLNVYKVTDKQGREILSLSETMLPRPAFNALLARLQGRTDRENRSNDDPMPAATESPAISAGFQTPGDSRDDFESEWNRMTGSMREPRKSLLDPYHRGVLMGLVLMLAPFVLGTAYLCYQSLWFSYGAERVLGQVVEVKYDVLPSLVVEYRPASGEVLQIESDGTEAYAAFKVGDSLTVYYEAGNPENARIGLFLEIWLGTLIMGGFTGIVLLAAVLIGRGLTVPMPKL